MIYLTQLIYLQAGQEDTFDQFESVAIPLISRYRGSLLLRMRHSQDSLIEGTMELPYETHVVSFPSESDFLDFMKDETRKQFLHLKEQSIRAVWLMKGEKLG
ncbi:MAG: DUF1330 domain-containing protein [Bacteroidetes bacterium]|nr:DUF1330 domain-containing protein [Bacteroidota bacterium]